MEISGKTVLTGLLGSPVAHSISPAMHNAAFQELGLDFVYLAFDVGREGLADAVQGLKTLGVRGFNLTMPLKNDVVSLCDKLSPAAELSGAVNTVVNDGGRLGEAPCSENFDHITGQYHVDNRVYIGYGDLVVTIHVTHNNGIGAEGCKHQRQ